MSFYDISSLVEHKLFKSLPVKVPVGSQKCRSLVACNGDVVYVWNCSKGRVEAVNKKLVARDSDLSTIRRFYPSRRPLFNVERILLNSSGTLLALWGTMGVSVMQLITSWTKEAEGPKEMPSVNLGQRNQSGGDQKVRRVQWHPGSPLDCHLVVLTSDECLRLYDAATGSFLWSCCLSYRAPSRSNLPGLLDLGETPVDFAFSTPVLHREMEEIQWPILVLWGNGEVYKVVTKLKDTNEKMPLVGPLLMYPESDDNYGIDASSILVLDTSPPVVVLATCTGTIYNCLLLPSEDADSPNDPGKSLHFVESIELELGLTVGDSIDDAVSCPIKLEKDPIEKSRYICIHDAGIHTVTLPLVTKLMEFGDSTDDEFSYSSHSLAEYLLCTAVVSDTGLTNNPILGLSHIDLEYYLVLLSDGKVMMLRLPNYSAYSAMNLLSSVDRRSDDDDGFGLMIQGILKSSSKPPLLNLPENAAADSRVMLEIVLGIMRRHREDVFKTYKTAAQKIKDRVQMLKVSMVHQRKNIERLLEYKGELQSAAEQIAERYEEINEKQNDLMGRTEDLLKKFRCREGPSTKSEKKLNNILDNVSVRLEHVKKEMERIQVTVESRNFARSENSTNRDAYLGETKKKMIRSYLEDITTEMQSLTKRVKDLRAISSDLVKD